MSKFWRRNEPMGCIDIGLWMYYLELLSFVSIFFGTGMVIFTSKKSTLQLWYGETPYHTVLLGVFIVQHILFALKFLLSQLMFGPPEWIIEEQQNMAHRVEQVQNEINNKNLIKKLSNCKDEKDQKKKDIEFVEQLLNDQHQDREIASLLIPKFLKGAEEYINDLPMDLQNEINQTLGK